MFGITKAKQPDARTEAVEGKEGTCIPPEYYTSSRVQTDETAQPSRPLLLQTAGIGLLLLLGVGVGVSSVVLNTSILGYSQTATAIVADQSTLVETFTNSNRFADMRAALIDEGQTFIEVQLSALSVSVYERGELSFQAPITLVGSGSWAEVPPGLYEVEATSSSRRSDVTGLMYPHVTLFEGNLSLHGRPVGRDGEEVEFDTENVSLLLHDEDAKKIAEVSVAGIPVLVFEDAPVAESFIYETNVAGMTASAYAVSDIETGQALVAYNMKESVPIASLTKLMTALVAVETIPLEERVPILQERYVTTLIPRLTGRYELPSLSLVRLLLVESSNEAAEVLATHIGREEFIELMNTRANALRMFTTTFTDPSGLEDGNVSSVLDLEKMVRYLHRYRPFLLEMTAENTVATAYTEQDFRRLENFNEVSEESHFLGGKVGETTAAGQTSVSLHSLSIGGEERVVLVTVLGSSARTRDIERLLEHVLNTYN